VGSDFEYLLGACSGAVIANPNPNSIFTVENDPADAFGSLVLDYVDLNDLILQPKVVGLHLRMQRALSNEIIVSHFKSQRGDLIYSVPQHF
jgi:hypothetical protein